jgi:diketogulonate reductase-like aldo/keto reductase
MATTQPTLRTVQLPSDEKLPAIGQGTRGMAEDPRRRDEEIAALRAGIDLGLTVVDTAEMYADGGTEELVGSAIEGRRDEVFLVTKVAPGNASRIGAVDACERSLRRLRTDRIDLYLLHWRGSVPLDETVEAFTTLITQGLIRHWGVSNVGLPDLADLTRIPGGTAVETDQVLYNLDHRGIEWDLLPRCREAGLPVMAYAPFDQGRTLEHPTLTAVARRHNATAAQVGLAWSLRQDGMCTIAKAGNPEHVRQNRAATDLVLSPQDLAELDRSFPPPAGPGPLERL